MSFFPSLPNSSLTGVQVNRNILNVRQPNEKQRVGSGHYISANTPQLTISGDISQILSQFECCVCLEYINPPILQCRDSHVFCQSCRQKFKSPAKCPTCRVVLLQTDIRSHSLEQIADSLGLQFQCKYSSNGCNVISLLTEKAKHEELCEFVPYCCPHVFSRCQWLGSREQVIQHLVDRHKCPINESNSSHFPIKLNDSKGNVWRSLLQYKNQNFIYIIQLDSERTNFKAIVLFIGEQRIADQFKYKYKYAYF